MNFNNNENEYKLSSLLSKYEIRVPNIQRGYAQGRKMNLKSTELLGDSFLLYIKEKIKTGKDIKLDFIYAYESGKPKKIYPYDGQQRLTTLWLLHIYFKMALAREGKICEDIVFSKFSYENRDSSSKFCIELANHQNKIETDGKTKTIRLYPLSSTICNCNWFYSYWKLDPTIIGMLNMLDKICLLFDNEQNKEDLYKKVENITFCLVITDKTDDELYIKMNSRGKGLSNFENFKADLLDYIYENDTNKEKQKYIDYSEYFEYGWAEIFWKCADIGAKVRSEISDDLFFKFVNRFFLMKYILNESELNSVRKIDIENIDIEDNYSDFYENMFKEDKNDINDNANYVYKNFNTYKKILDGEKEKDLINDFKKVLDKIEKYNGKFKDKKLPVFDEDNKNFERIEFKDRVEIYGLYFFLIYNDLSNKDLLNKWENMVENIANNTPLDSKDAFKTCIRNVFKLSKCLEKCLKVTDFYGKIEQKYEDEKININQVQEEIIKCLLCKTEPKFELIFQCAEKIKSFNGRIRVLFKEANYKLKIKDFVDEQKQKAANIESREKIAEEILNTDKGFNEKKYGWLLYKYLLNNNIDDYKKILQNYTVERMRLYFLDCIEKFSIDEILNIDVNKIKSLKSEIENKIKPKKEIIKLLNNDKNLKLLHEGWAAGGTIRKNSYTLDKDNKTIIRGNKNTKDPSKIKSW